MLKSNLCIFPIAMEYSKHWMLFGYFVSVLGKKGKMEIQVIHNTDSRDWIEQNTNPI